LAYNTPDTNIGKRLYPRLSAFSLAFKGGFPGAFASGFPGRHASRFSLSMAVRTAAAADAGTGQRLGHGLAFPGSGASADQPEFSLPMGT